METMAQWRELLKLGATLKSRVSRLYKCKPIEMIICLSDWIESQDWDLAAADEATARTCFQNLLLKLDKLIDESFYNSCTVEDPDLSLLKTQLMNHFEHHSQDMEVTPSESEERMILDSHEVAQIGSLASISLPQDNCLLPPEKHDSPTAAEQTQTDLDNKVHELETVIKKTDEEMKVLKSVYKTWISDVNQLNGRANPQLQQQYLNEGNAIRSKIQVLVEQVKGSVDLAGRIVPTLVFGELPAWKRRQQMSCIGKPVNTSYTSLDQLEKWFTSVAEMLLQIIQQLQKLQTDDVSQQSDIVQLINTAKTLLTELLKNALVVETQPVMHSQPHRPLVIRTTVTFTVKLRFLPKMSILKDGCLITAELDKDVENVEDMETVKGFRQFQFTSNNTKVMAVDRENGSLVAELDMVIEENKKKRNRSNKTPILVTQELHIISFSADLRVADLQVEVESNSLPMVVVSTTTQGPSAWASVMWYNLLSVSRPTSLSVFMDAPSLSWKMLSQALSWQFISAGGRELSQDQLDELKLKITVDPDGLVSWSKFSDQKEGPWIWISGILDLIERHLTELWRDGFIMGFVNRENTKVLLQSKQSGTFLLRFSEKNREGAISVSLIERDEQGPTIQYIRPFTKEKLSKTSLANVIKHYRQKGRSSNPLVYLYPDIPRDNAFGSYYATDETSKQVPPYLGWTDVCEGDCPTPLPSSTYDDLMNIPTTELMQMTKVAFDGC